MVFHHVYMIVDGKELYDYDLYIPFTPYSRKTEEDPMLFDENCFNIFSEKNSSSSGVPVIPKNTKIYLAPGCPKAIDDIRKNYVIKRTPDAGDYNILTPLPFMSYYFRLSTLVVYPDHKTIVGARQEMPSATEARALVQRLLPGFVDDNFFTFNGAVFLYQLSRKKHGIFEKALKGELKKPCVTYHQLDLNSGLPLTTDILELVYNTGKVDYRSTDAEKNYLIQLNVLNQHDWRKYPGTVRTLIYELLSKNCINCCVANTKSRYPKAIQEIMGTRKKSFLNDDDRDLCRQFIEKFLEIGNCKYASVADLIAKLNTIHLSLSTFGELYNNIVRITPRQNA